MTAYFIVLALALALLVVEVGFACYAYGASIRRRHVEAGPITATRTTAPSR